MKAIRDYTFECCWLFVLLIVSIAPAPASAQTSVRNFLDEVSDCSECYAYCTCPDIEVVHR